MLQSQAMFGEFGSGNGAVMAVAVR